MALDPKTIVRLPTVGFLLDEADWRPLLDAMAMAIGRENVPAFNDTSEEWALAFRRMRDVFRDAQAAHGRASENFLRVIGLAAEHGMPSNVDPHEWLRDRLTHCDRLRTQRDAAHERAEAAERDAAKLRRELRVLHGLEKPGLQTETYEEP